MSRTSAAILLLGACIGLTAGCATSKTEAASSVTQTIVSGGVSRTYLLHQPTNLRAGERAPLMIALHAGGYNAGSWETFTGFSSLADEKGFVVAYPEWHGTNWDIGCCNSVESSPADVEFIGAVIDHLVASADVDPGRVYVTGFSLGGYMAYRLACELPAIAGMGDVGASEYLSIPCHPQHPVSIYEIHGTRDYYGGSCGGRTESDAGCPNAFGTMGYEPSVAQVNEQWRSTDGCAGTAATQIFGSVTEQTWEACLDGSGVRLDTLAETGHCWPTPTTCGDFDAGEALWSFLSAHSLAAGKAEEEKPKPGEEEKAKGKEEEEEVKSEEEPKSGEEKEPRSGGENPSGQDTETGSSEPGPLAAASLLSPTLGVGQGSAGSASAPRIQGSATSRRPSGKPAKSPCERRVRSRHASPASHRRLPGRARAPRGPSPPSTARPRRPRRSSSRRPRACRRVSRVPR